MPGMQPAGDEQAIWDAGRASGEDYYATKAKAVAARNKFTQSQPAQSLPELAKGSAKLVSGMAFAGPEIVKGGIQQGAAALKESFPTSKTASRTAAAADFAANAIPTNPGELAAQAVGERYAAPVAQAAGRVLNPVAKKAVGFMAEKFGGLSNDVTQMLEARAPDVMKYARQGVDAATEAAASAAKAVKAHIDNFADRAGDSYREAIEKLVQQNPSYNSIRIDMQRLAGNAVESIRQDFGFPDNSTRLPNLQLLNASGRAVQAAQGTIERVGKAASDVDLFNDFAAQFKKSMTPTQAYLLQKDLSYAIRANAEKPIAAALTQLKRSAVQAFDSVVQDTPLSKINSDYRVAMTLAEDLAKVSNADNAVSVINTAFRNRSETRDALNTITSISPGVKKSLEDMFAATAGKQVAHWTAQLPPTGAKALYQMGIGGSGALIVHNPITGIPAAATYMAATSPRVYGEAFNALSKGLPQLPKGTATAAIAALRARRGAQ